MLIFMELRCELKSNSDVELKGKDQIEKFKNFKVAKSPLRKLLVYSQRKCI